MRVTYVGMHDEVEIAGHADVVVRDVPVDVPDELAGRAPHGHRGDDDFDPGFGLLAQPSNWQNAKTVKPAKHDAAPAPTQGD